MPTSKEGFLPTVRLKAWSAQLLKPFSVILTHIRKENITNAAYTDKIHRLLCAVRPASALAELGGEVPAFSESTGVPLPPSTQGKKGKHSSGATQHPPSTAVLFSDCKLYSCVVEVSGTQTSLGFFKASLCSTKDLILQLSGARRQFIHSTIKIQTYSRADLHSAIYLNNNTGNQDRAIIFSGLRF